MTTTVERPSALKDLVGTHLGWSAWQLVDQDRIQAFADATGDHQWIHLDAERAKTTPFGGTIAHGLLTLSLAPALVYEMLEVQQVGFLVNYGLNKVRFPAPVPSGSKVRMGAELAAAEDVKGGTQVVLSLTFEADGQDKPVCVADLVLRYLE